MCLPPKCFSPIKDLTISLKLFFYLSVRITSICLHILRAQYRHQVLFCLCRSKHCIPTLIIYDSKDNPSTTDNSQSQRCKSTARSTFIQNLVILISYCIYALWCIFYNRLILRTSSIASSTIGTLLFINNCPAKPFFILSKRYGVMGANKLAYSTSCA